MSFIYTKNISNTTGAAGWYHLKELLKTAGWTVMSSSDGTTYSSSSDVITTGSSGAGGMNNTSAWFRIQMPAANGVTREFTFQRTGSSLTATIKYSFSAGFIGGSPNATTTPTATDEQTVSSGTIWAADNTFHLNLAADNASPYGFWMGIILNGNTNSANTGGMLFEPMIGGPSSDPDPYVIYVEDSAGGSSWTEAKVIGVTAKAWFYKGLSYETFTGLGGCQMFGSAVCFPLKAGSNPYTFKDEIGPILWARKVTNSSILGIKGFGTVMKWNGTKKISGSTLTVSTDKDRIVLADVNFPWDGTLPVI